MPSLNTVRKFRATTIQDASSLPWKCWNDTEKTTIRDEIWGVTLNPCPIYASLDENQVGVGEPLYYEWYALLDPEIALPDWITEVTPAE